jgi:hypothetical protein
LENHRRPPNHHGSSGSLAPLGGSSCGLAEKEKPGGVGGSFSAAAGGLLRRMQLQQHKRAPSMLQFDIELTDSEDMLNKR